MCWEVVEFEVEVKGRYCEGRSCVREEMVIGGWEIVKDCRGVVMERWGES